MNRDRLLQLGYELGRAFGGRSQGAWFARAADGVSVVLKWSDDPAMAKRYAELLPALDALSAHGVPVPDYRDVVPFEGGILSAQTFLPGQSDDNPPPAVIDSVVESINAQAGIPGPPPPGNQPGWGAFVVAVLTHGGDDLGQHAPLQDWNEQTAGVLERIRKVGADADPDRFPDNGLVHLDLHTDNILIHEGRLSGIIDWEEACTGDPLYDLVQFAFDLDGHDQPVWEIVDRTGIAPDVLRAYIAFLVLKCTSSAIVHDPDDVGRQMARADRVFARYGL